MRERDMPKPLEELRDRCSVSDLCDGACRELHFQVEGLRCPAWYSDEMEKKKVYRKRR